MIIIILHFTIKSIIKLYTQNEEIASKASNNFKIYTYIYIFDGIQINLCALIKALGL